MACDLLCAMSRSGCAGAQRSRVPNDELEQAFCIRNGFSLAGLGALAFVLIYTSLIEAAP